MIKTIAHLADIHIRKTPTRNTEYQEVFDKLIESLKEQKPDRIALVGDLVNDYLDLQGEQLIMAHKFLNALAAIAPVRITRGNHDCRKKNLKRVDSIKAIVETLNNPNVIYYDGTGFFDDENVTWAVWHHGDPKNNPWKTREGKKVIKERVINARIYIDLFHDPITGCRSATDFEMKSSSYYKITDFKGDYSFFGDIHRFQYLDKDKKKAYCSSLIPQSVDEGDDAFHGYLLWDILKQTTAEIEIPNNYSFKNIRLTPYTDFDDLDIEIDNPTDYMKVRLLWGTLPQTRNNENERKVVQYFKAIEGITSVSHKNEFLENDKVELNESVTLENVSDEAVQQEIFKEYLDKIGAEESVVNDVLALDVEILKEIEIEDNANIEWGIIKFGGKNFMSYGELDVDWRDMDGLYQITGRNTAGKTTIMKIITYLLYNKTLETETRKKFGDSRFVNNRNDAKFCEAYMVMEANGEYFGIKRKTVIERKRDGTINGAPTTLNYYLLTDPDEEMTDDNLVEKLDEDRRVQTQKLITSVIGSYDNFMRVVMTTSDTLNNILSSDMADFIDAILLDSGLDIFDKKLAGYKTYEKRVNAISRVTCNIEATLAQNTTLTEEINVLTEEIEKIETVKLPATQDSLSKGRDYIEKLTKSLFKIDPEIYNLNVDDAKEDIGIHNTKIDEQKARMKVVEGAIAPLRESYDEERLNELLEKKENHKQTVYDKNILIKEEQRAKADHQHQIELLNGKIHVLKRDGKAKKDEILELKGSKICPTCGQLVAEDHQEHINEKIERLETEMYGFRDEIEKHESEKENTWTPTIEGCDITMENINKEIVKLGLEMEGVMVEIGELTNQKNDVEKRRELQTELNQLPTLIQNEELKISILQQKIDSHENMLEQITKNQKIEKGIVAAKERVRILALEEGDHKEDIFIRKTTIGEKGQKIKDNNTLISEFEQQEYRDMVMGLYKKCVHRDGIPRELLSNHIIPKINIVLQNVLSVAEFMVWLDQDDLRPKLVYNSRPNAVIDCISGSGKERTFSAIVIKIALNQINVKAKPTIFLLDEVMGKLDEEGSVDEFIEMLQIIKTNVKKMLVIEHKYEINPDYLINVQVDDDGISSAELV